jgi:hypothetical protein
MNDDSDTFGLVPLVCRSTAETAAPKNGGFFHKTGAHAAIPEVVAVMAGRRSSVWRTTHFLCKKTWVSIRDEQAKVKKYRWW